MFYRPRRLRRTPVIRELVAETRLSKDMFVYPYFVVPGKNIQHAVAAMPGINHFSVDTLIKDIEEGLKHGVNKVLLFGVNDKKSEDGSTSYNKKALIPHAVASLKKHFGNDLLVMTDVCLCAYTTHGHCGVLHHNEVDNDASVAQLVEMALAHAHAGADVVAPSDMMDGRVEAIRESLDNKHLENTLIMSYSVKFSSAYYGPFREAADSAPAHGDRKSYQMDSRNRREALKEAALDEDEGADILMVKPALAYMDIIREIRDFTTLPLACYNVSGEYSMVKAAAAQGWIDEQKIVMENMFGFARAGADIIISYHARDICEKGWI